MKTIFTNGVWDMFHYGHYNLLRRAKKHGDILLVGVATDKSCEKYKRKPHQPWKVRVNSVKNLPFVDNIIETEWSRDLTEDFYRTQNIYLQVQGDNTSDFRVANRLGILKKVGRTNGISTSGIIDTLVKNEPISGGHMNDIRSAFVGNTPYIIKTSSNRKSKLYNINAPLNRIYNEYESIMSFREHLNNPSYISNPICFDPDSYTIVFEKAPQYAELLSDNMNSNIVPDITYALSEMHNATLENSKLLKKHSNTESFLDVKIKIQCLEATKDKDILKYIHNFIEKSLKIKKVLLHGDIAPKNILIWDNTFLIIDFEEGSYSDPALDIGYFIAHFILYGYKDIGKRIFSNYMNNIKYSDNTFVDRINTYIGIFLLSRIDSRANDTNIDESNKQAIRKQAKKFIYGDVTI